MNPSPDSAFWFHLLAWLAGETAAALALAALAAWILRSPAWRRTLWQAAFVALGLIVGTELTGAGRHVVQRLIARPQPTRHFIVRGNLPVTVAPNQPADVAAGPADALSPREATAVPAPPPPSARWWPGGLWLAGSGLLLARFVVARFLLLVAGGRRRRVADDALRGQVERIRHRLGLRRRVRLAECPGLRSPIAFGVLRPTIGLPARFRDAFPSAQREAMLAHEVAHLAARDPLWHGLAEVVTAALWWQPLVWWARRQLHAASESAADEASLVVEDGPCALAECLVNLGKRLDRRRALVWLGVEGGGYRSGLGRRVQRLLELDGAAWRPVTWNAKLVLLVSPCVVAALTVAVAAWAAPQGDAEPSLVALVEQTLASASASDASVPAASTNAEPKQKLVPGPGESGIAFEVRPSVREPGHILLVGPGRELRLDSKPILLDELEAGLARAKGTNADLNVLLLFRGEEGREQRLRELRPILDRAGANVSVITGAPGWFYQSATNAPADTNSTVQSNRLHAATLTQDGKLLYEMGKLDEAEIKLRQAIKEDPDNHAAAYYLNRIAEARPGDPSATNPAPFFRRVIPTNQGRQAIMSKLNRIRLPEVKFDRVELGAVVRRLNEEMKRLDPETAGILFRFAAAPGTRFEDLMAVRVTINPPLRNVCLPEVLEAVVKGADRPIHCGGGSRNIDFCFLPQITNSIPRVPNGSDSDVASNRPHAATLTQDGKLLYEMGKLDEAEAKLRQAIKEDPANKPARYYLKRVEDSRSGGATANAAPATNTLTGVLTDPQFRDVIRALEQRNGVGSFAAPDLTTQQNAEPKVVSSDVVADSAVPAAERRSPPASASPAAASPALAPLRMPPQVSIQAKFAEISASGDPALNFDWFLGNVLIGQGKTGVLGGNGTGIRPTGPAQVSVPDTNASGVGTITGILTDAQFSNLVAVLDARTDGTVQELRGDQFDWPGRAATNAQNIRVTAGLGPNLCGILTAPQYRVVLHALEQRAGTEILMLPAVTTLSGREAQVRATDVRTVLTGINPEVIVRPGTKAKDAPKSPTFFFASLACGPVLDVAPSVLPDGQTVNLALTASVTEFLGYDPPKRGDQVRVWQDGRRKLVARPTPRVRFRRMQGQARLEDGQTLVVVGPVVEKRRLLVFVTPTIVDPAGNRVHPDDQLPSRGNAVPPQK